MKKRRKPSRTPCYPFTDLMLLLRGNDIRHKFIYLLTKWLMKTYYVQDTVQISSEQAHKSLSQYGVYILVKKMTTNI